MILEALDPLLSSNEGELRDFTEKMYNENLIDVFESQGKQSGAYMSSTWVYLQELSLIFLEHWMIFLHLLTSLDMLIILI